MKANTIILNNGIEMPRIGFGTWPLKGENASQAVTQAIEIGYRLIDTAARYENEEAIGKSIQQLPINREELFITSKLRGSQHGYYETIKAFHQTLKRLQLEYLDLYLIHWPNPSKNRYIDSWKAFVTLYNQGLIRAIGVSNFKPLHLSRLIDETGVIPALNQIQLNPMTPQKQLQQWCDRYQITCQSWSPLGRGSMIDHPLLKAIAKIHHKSPAQIILRWHLQNNLAIIPKSATSIRMIENLDIFNFTLTDQDIRAIGTLERQSHSKLFDPDFYTEE